jgi:hypothetical protein
MLLFVHAFLSYPALSFCVLFMPASLYVSQFSCLSCLQNNFPSGPPPPSPSPPHLSGRTRRVFIRQLLFQLLTGRRGVKTWRLSQNLHRHPSKTASHPDTRGSHPDTRGSHPDTPGSHPDTRGSHPDIPGSHPDTPGSHPDTPVSHPDTAAVILTLRAVIPTLEAVILILRAVIRTGWAVIPTLRGSHPGISGLPVGYLPQLDGHPDPNLQFAVNL